MGLSKIGELLPHSGAFKPKDTPDEDLSGEDISTANSEPTGRCAAHNMTLWNNNPCLLCADERREKLVRDHLRGLHIQKCLEENIPSGVQFNLASSPNIRATQQVLEWVYGSRGILAYGSTRRGKSFALYELMRREIISGRDATCMTIFRFALAVSEAQSGFTLPALTDRLVRTPNLFIDDIGQIMLGEQAEGVLFGIVNERLVNNKPTMFTTNYRGLSGDRASGEIYLEDRFQPMRGVPFVARLREVCETIKF